MKRINYVQIGTSESGDPIMGPEDPIPVGAVVRSVEGGVMVYGPDDDIPPLPAPSLAELMAAKSAENTANCESTLAPLGAEYGETERATWDQQYAEAQALMASPAAVVPLLDAMATARGMDKGELAQRIIRNRETWVLISGSVVGQRQRIEDAIQASETAESLAAIDMTITLPA